MRSSAAAPPHRFPLPSVPWHPAGSASDDTTPSHHPGAFEECDGFDNDCDGQVDELYDVGDACTLGVGACAVPGVIACAGGLEDCLALDSAPGTPGVEVCNDLDDDCDGTVDEDVATVGDACDAGDCGAGTVICENGALSCEALVEFGPEECNGADDDCDGLVDEAPGGGSLTRACYLGSPELLGVGTCTAGVETCIDGLYQSCTGQVLPVAEFCDALDNDCDGLVDEADPQIGAPCVSGVGVCASSGVSYCESGILACSGVPTAGSPELCNSLDDDCDGTVDEGPDQLALAFSCYPGPDGTVDIGECRSGSQTCVGGVLDACVAAVVPNAESCDGLDNDCDGLVDEEPADAGGGCSVGEGECAAVGVVFCTPGVGLACDGVPGSPLAELCDGLDNDCDGIVDEEGCGDAGVDAGFDAGPDSGSDGGGSADAGADAL